MTATFNDTVTMVTEECCNCGMVFAVTKSYQARKRSDHTTFYCPNGHAQSYTGETEAEKYRRMMESAQASANSWRERVLSAERNQERTAKQLRNLKKRTAAGVCPCCSRTVSQLQRHMQSKHKEFLELNGLKPPKALPPAPENIQ